MPFNVRLTKIVATLGPASETQSQIADLIAAGVNVFRINASHGTPQWRQMVYDRIRAAAAEAESHIGILLDLAGPKIRVNEMCCNPLPLEVGERVIIVRHALPQSGKAFSSTFPEMIDDCRRGQDILLDDGAMSLRVVDKQRDSLICEVTGGGILLPRKGINLPQTEIRSPALTAKDRDDLAWGLEAGVDFVGLSFVRQSQDIKELRALLDAAGSPAAIVAKIEKPQAVQHIEEIIDAADAIMVARGDLGVEMPVEDVPLLQKRMIRLAHQAGKPVITATQMLQSMIESASPTRAEVSDVANSILDGTDAVMLSGETAVGKHPVKSVAMMDRVSNLTEDHELEFGSRNLSDAERKPFASNCGPKTAADSSSSSSSSCILPLNAALARAALAVIDQIHAAAIVVLTHSGATALAVSKERPPVPIIAVSDRRESCRRMSLYRGVTAVLHGELIEAADLRGRINDLLLSGNWVEPSDAVVIISGRFPGKSGSADMLQVHKITAR